MKTRNDSPCVKDCPRRSYHCHGDCEAYAAFVERRIAQSRAKRNDRGWTYAKSVTHRRTTSRPKNMIRGDLT